LVVVVVVVVVWWVVLNVVVRCKWKIGGELTKGATRRIEASSMGGMADVHLPTTSPPTSTQATLSAAPLRTHSMRECPPRRSLAQACILI
jgi:hypothetical protein